MIRLCALLGILAAVAPCGAADDAKVPLTIEIPEAVLAGTPPNVLALLFPELEKPPEGKPPELMVPAGTVNLARDKKVTSSDSNPVLGKLSLITDGQKRGSEDAYVELGPMLQWVQIDLGQPCQIYVIGVWHYFREARGYHDCIVQLADDEAMTKNVRMIYNNDMDNSAKLGVGKSRAYIETNTGKLIEVDGAKARYVRLYSSGNTANDLNHYVEVEVYGKPAS